MGSSDMGPGIARIFGKSPPEFVVFLGTGCIPWDLHSAGPKVACRMYGGCRMEDGVSVRYSRCSSYEQPPLNSQPHGIMSFVFAHV